MSNETIETKTTNNNVEPVKKSSKQTEKLLTLAVSSLQAAKSVLAAVKAYVKHFGNN